MKDEKSAARTLLERAGIRRGQEVLDFGCGTGKYSLPAASAVGTHGKVFAVDKDAERLKELSEKARSAGLDNIVAMHTHGGPTVELEARSVDAALLFDVLHRYIFPEPEQRARVLDEVHRVLKEDSLLLLYPTHMDARKLTAEVESRGFRLTASHSGRMQHDGRTETGSVLVFIKIPTE